MSKNQQLSDADRSLRFTTDSLPQLAWIARPDGYREYFNRQWFEFTGTEPSEDEGDAWIDLVYPADKKRVMAAWRHSVKTGEIYEIEYRLYHARTQTYRWVIGRALPYIEDSGKITKWYGTSTDIDEQKRTSQIQTFLSNASKELASSLDYNTTLQKVTDLCVPEIADWCSVDLYDEATGFNQVSIAHVDPRQISVAKDFRKHNPIRIDDPGGVPLVIRTGKSVFYPRITKDMYELIKHDKKTYDFMMSLNLHSFIIAPIYINNKVAGGISFVSSDSGRYYTDTDLAMAEELAARISLAITNSKLYAESMADIKQRKKLERELNLEKNKLESWVEERTIQLQLTNRGLRQEIKKRRFIEEQRVQHLVELNRSKDEFISIASHQLRTPATGVKQYVGMLLEGFVGDLPPEQRAILQKAYDSNERQLKIVSDLLKVAQVDAGKVMLRKNHINVNEFIHDIIRDQIGVFDARSQTIEYHDAKPDIVLYIDAASMRMVIENLIDNASKYSEEKTNLKITARETPEHVIFKFHDEGVGIDPKNKSRLFEKFSRLNNPLSAKVGGTGLGLYWARKIVELHGGKITYTSNKDRGTTFTIKVPKNDKV